MQRVVRVTRTDNKTYHAQPVRAHLHSLSGVIRIDEGEGGALLVTVEADSIEEIEQVANQMNEYPLIEKAEILPKLNVAYFENPIGEI